MKMNPILAGGIIICTLAGYYATAKLSAVNYASPSAVIYKTKGDYSKNVPVTLSDDKSKIVSYPAVQDIYYKGALAYPTPLAKGYWLDNRGINVNSAFLK